MPELPEVETISRALREGGRGGPPLTGLKIASVQVAWDRSVQHPEVEEFKRRLPGQIVQGTGRRGKFILVHLSQDDLVIHLRMSGDLRVEPERDETGEVRPIGNHDRVIIRFENHIRLTFEDTRKFGRIWLVGDAAELLGGLGPEPFDPDLTTDIFCGRLNARKRLIKPLLLDQSFLAGMGNIYTDEALHLAGIHPQTLSSQISKREAEKLLMAVRNVLAKGIEQNGASIDWVYRGGGFQNFFNVYRRSGERCRTCGHEIVRIVVGQRSTHFCPVCQPLK